MFSIKNTFKNVASPQNQQRGQPAPGSGAQQTGPARQGPPELSWRNMSPLEGYDSWPSTEEFSYGNPSFPVDAQRGQPAPEGLGQAYLPGQLNPGPRPDGTQYYRVTREFSRGAQRSAPITPIVFTPANPGQYVPHKPSVVPRYPLGQYINNTIFWANQVIPTSVPLAGLQTEKSLDAMLSDFVVYGKSKAI